MKDKIMKSIATKNAAKANRNTTTIIAVNLEELLDEACIKRARRPGILKKLKAMFEGNVSHMSPSFVMSMIDTSPEFKAILANETPFPEVKRFESALGYYHENNIKIVL